MVRILLAHIYWYTLNNIVYQINRVKKEGNVGEGITFEAFKCFYNVLFGGADLERAMFFLDTEKNGINR